MEQIKFPLFVRCMTYNHAPYILDAMNGFTMQETNFPFYCKIIDDASTDGEQAIIRQYFKEYFDLEDQSVFRQEENEDYIMLFARHKVNLNCFFAICLLKYNHYRLRKAKIAYYEKDIDNVKYVALCEGDDYWINPNKVQMQVDFLESHPNHSLCIHAYRLDTYHGSDIVSKDIHKYPTDVEIIPDKDVFNTKGMFSATASMLYRASAIQNYPEWTKNAPVGDRPLKFVLFARGHIAYINKVMSVYRLGVPGSWTNRVAINKKAEKTTRAKFIQLLVDFDEWTNRKYHKLTMKSIHETKLIYFKRDIKQYIKKLYSSVSNILRTNNIDFPPKDE